jgi:outer membrane protein TolC
MGEPLVGGFWNLLLGVAQPVFEGGRRLDEIKRQKAAFREELAAYHKAVLNAFREVEDALASFRASGKEMHHLEKLAEATQGDVRLSKERYFLGLTEYLPVLTAQTLDLEARTRLIVSRGRYISEWISLVRALGGTWPDTRVAERLKK